MSSAGPDNVTSSPPQSTDSAMVPAEGEEGEDKTLYIWIPYALFLLAIFITLAASFVKHTRRVLKRRSVYRDYLQANVLWDRRRICPTFCSSGDQLLLQGFRQPLPPRQQLESDADSSLRSVFTDGGEVGASSHHHHHHQHHHHHGQHHHHHHQEHKHHQQHQGYAGGEQYLAVPGLTGRGLLSAECGAVLGEEAGSPWGTTHGRHNLAFTLDEDLSGKQTRPVRPPGMQRVPSLPSLPSLAPGPADGSPSRISRCATGPPDRGRGRLQRSQPSGSSLTNDSCASCSLASEPDTTIIHTQEHAPDSFPVQNAALACSSPLCGGGRRQCSSPDSSEVTLTCPHCGSCLPLHVSNSNPSRTHPRRKKKKKDKRQPVGRPADSFQQRPGLAAECLLSDSRFPNPQRPGDRHQSNYFSASTGLPLPAWSWKSGGGQDSCDTSVTHTSLPFYPVACQEERSWRRGEEEEERKSGGEGGSTRQGGEGGGGAGWPQDGLEVFTIHVNSSAASGPQGGADPASSFPWSAGR
ncbi:uncharacterized protein LOC143292355 isoform X2 [Babylonia areolata]|uniref:uncharacterized protein LOC143292355 isoform X2 n=1 Tax=Babylonia areolata TaxID=304850 RepID=UPI003FD67689